LTKILVSVFNAIIGDNVEFRKVSPFDYKLFQTADFICSLSLIQQKLIDGKNFSASEKDFFGSHRILRKKYMRRLENIKL
jgi:hypothetical protein